MAVSVQSLWQTVSTGAGEEETVSEKTGDELIMTLIPVPWCWGRQVENQE